MLRGRIGELTHCIADPTDEVLVDRMFEFLRANVVFCIVTEITCSPTTALVVIVSPFKSTTLLVNVVVLMINAELISKPTAVNEALSINKYAKSVPVVTVVRTIVMLEPFAKNTLVVKVIVVAVTPVRVSAVL